MNKIAFISIFSALSISVLLQACTPVVVGTAATGVVVAHDRRTTGTVIDDQGIEFKANQAFYEDKEIEDSSHVNVTSYNLVVLITGETPSEELKQRIGNIVAALPKVTHVYNELTISAPSSLVSRSSDSLITSKVKTRLLTIKDFDGTRVKVVTEKGIVYLMGLVTQQESEIATNAARQVGGVQKVVKLFQYID
ncbi:MAG: BON domain-containing protein [Gammaproteobacteria bacterium]|jgi:osmotically-inducible protein OsmY